MMKQSGVVTLMTTGLLLVVGLIITMGAYRAALYEIKRAQNEVESRKAYWQAEGGVECGVAQFVPTLMMPKSVTACDAGIEIVPSFTLDESTQEIILSAKAGSHVVSRRFIPSSSNLQSGALQSSGSFVAKSAVNITTPDPGSKLEDGKWDCTAVRFGGRFTANASITNSGVVHGNLPYQGFEHNEKDCVEKTIVNGSCSSDSQPQCLLSDFKKDSKLNIFKDFFGVEPQYHDSVRDSGDFHIIDLAGEQLGAKNCGAAIIEQLEADARKLWVEGSCVISSTELAAIKSALNPTGLEKKAITLVVHDGLFALQGAATLDGVVFHFNYDFSPSEEAWKTLDLADSAVAHFPDDYGLAVYYQGGSFSITGGVFFDYPDSSHVSLFRDSLSFHYNRDVIRQAQANTSLFTWKKGAWRDF
ncbi:hypothetical protein [Vibrio maritimus]|uniref:hypothetical protein n=1 Tax=Vibrio maritimus TaxID=990268 RepID=UPI001F41CDA7|nr:hypothetical protein [Vibrio maritimus]